MAKEKSSETQAEAASAENDEKGSKIGFDRAYFDKISDWTWSNAPAVISIAVASAIGNIVGFAIALALFALLNYYKSPKEAEAK
jgi:hypothetical protein